MENDNIQEYTQALQAAEEGQLSVDVYENEEAIIIRTITAGVHPDQIDIHVTPDLVTIRGERKQVQQDNETIAHYQEVFWGSFSRSIILPVHIQPSQAKAQYNHGMLTLTLPKVHDEMHIKIDTYEG